jgi:DNA-binding transcriptional ArsR family regulator
MTLSVDVTGLAEADVVFAPSPLAELAAMLHAVCEPGHHPELRDWVTATTQALPADVADGIRDSDLLWRSSRADFLLPAHPRATLSEELDVVDQLEDEAYTAAALITTSCGAVPLARARAGLRTARAREDAVGRARARGPRQAAFAERLIGEPEAVRAQIRGLLADCAEVFFDDAWSQLRGRLTAAARQSRDLFRRGGLAQAVRTVSPAITLDGDRLLVDKLQDATVDAAGGLTFSPTVIGWPHLLVVHAPGWRPVIQYPIAGPAIGAEPTLESVQHRLRALDHPLRMRLLRTLARGAHTTGELAAAWDLTAPEVSRHLHVLRAAGLITADRRGRYVFYALDLSTVSRLGTDLLGALLR